MNKLFLILVFSFASAIVFAQVKDYSEYPESMRKIILIDTVATEVILNRNGDILAIIRTIPDYFDEDKYVEEEITKDIDTENITSEEIIAAEKDATKIVMPTSSYRDHEISFKRNTAFIDPLQIAYLDRIIADLHSGRITQVRLFSFVNEPYHLARLLSERRLEAVTTYMKIKGIDIDRRVIIENLVEGQSNKIVFVSTN